MCATCGCTEIDHDQPLEAEEGHPHVHPHQHSHDGVRVLKLELDVLDKNRRFAEHNRRALHTLGVTALNLMSSPGAGKTTLLTRTIADLRDRASIAVIEGDQQTRRDADRILAAGARAIQINTGKGCHLDAHGVGHAIDELTPRRGSLLFIENVGNLVCPAEFDLGESLRVVLLSVTEGDDKPLKYPNIFASAHLLLLTKIDLIPWVEFDVARCTDYARSLNPALSVIPVSAKTGEGLPNWYERLAPIRGGQEP